MMWDEFDQQDFGYENEDTEREEQDSYLNFDIFSALSKLKDYYRVLEVDYDATDDAIRSNYIRLALKWHPDKQKDQDSATLRFQEINEAYQAFEHMDTILEANSNNILLALVTTAAWQKFKLLLYLVFVANKLLIMFLSVLSDPVKRREYDKKGMLYVYDYNIIEYLNRYKGLILTCNGLGLKHSIW
ncbi:hypothetical protein C3L33_10738, partial [Rhododendron williamsianum]